MSQNITLLGPVEQLPAEGFDAPAFKPANGSPTRHDLLRHYIEVMSRSDLGFRVNADGVTLLNGTGETPRFQHLDYRVNGSEPPAPWFDVSASFCEVDISSVLAGADEVPSEDDGAEAADYLRFFLERFREAFDLAARGFAGEKLPLLRWAKSGDGAGVTVQFLGVLLADDELIAELRGASGDDASPGLDESLGLILEEAEVEARGVREVMMSLAILGVTAGFAPKAEAGLLDQLFGGGDEPRVEQRHRQQQRTYQYRQAAPKVDQRLLHQAQGSHTRVVVDVSRQRAYLLVNGRIAIDTPVSTARTGKYTPRGEFKITQRVRTGKTSTIYGCDLPYWMRLDQSAIGMHVGELPGYPASAGCIRLPSNIAPLIFNATKSGTRVQVVNTWSPQATGAIYAQAGPAGGGTQG